MGGEHRQDLAVPQAQPQRPAGRREHHVGPAERLQPQAAGGARLQPRHRHRGRAPPRLPDGRDPGQLGLGHPRGRPDHGARLRRPDVVAAGHVDHAQDAAGGQIVDRGGGAAPALNRPDEVLGRADRHRRIEPERGAGGVGARVGLIPLGPLHERDRLRPPEHAGRAGHPQQLPLLVGHGHDGVALLRRLAEHVRQEREDLRQRVLGPVLPQHAPVQGDGRVAGVGLDPGGDRAQPRIRDDLPDPRGSALLDEAGVRVAHGHRASQSGHAPSEPRREAVRLPSRPAGPAYGMTITG